MPSPLIQTPAGLLLSHALPVSAKLVWMVAQRMPYPESNPTTWLCTYTGLSRTTVLAGLAQLAAQGWSPSPQACAPAAAPDSRPRSPTTATTAPQFGNTSPPTTVTIPWRLLNDTRLSPQARVLYGVLLLTPNFHHPGGRFTYTGLSALAHASRPTLGLALDQLVRAEWVTLEQTNQKAPIVFELTFPGREREETALAAAQDRLSKKDLPWGESIMREYLSLLIDSDGYEDNAYPGFLRHPRTKELLQIDRYYPHLRLGWEFNGPQHYRATEKYPAETVAVQQERDLIKRAICSERGITLVTVTADDLSLARMRQKLPPGLPLRDTGDYDMLIDYLDAEGLRCQRELNKL